MSLPQRVKQVHAGHVATMFGCVAVFHGGDGLESSLFWEVEPGKTLEATITKEGARAIRVVIIGVGVAYMSPYMPANTDDEVAAFIAKVAEVEA